MFWALFLESARMIRDSCFLLLFYDARTPFSFLNCLLFLLRK